MEKNKKAEEQLFDMLGNVRVINGHDRVGDIIESTDYDGEEDEEDFDEEEYEDDAEDDEDFEDDEEEEEDEKPKKKSKK